MKRLRVAHLHADLPPESNGGVAHQVDALANVQARLGWAVTVYSLSPGPPDAAYRTRTVEAPGWISRRAARPFCLSWYFGQLPLDSHDIVHVHGDGHLMPRRLPLIRTFYGTALHEALSAGSLKHGLFQLAIYPTELLSVLPARVRCGISRSTCRAIPACHEVVPCGIDLATFRPGGQRAASPRLLFVGTLDGRKRGRWLRDRLRRIRRRVPGTELVLIGPEPASGEGWRALGRVSTEELVGQYREAWLLVSPSRYEGFGIPLIEAMACGTAIAATPHPGALEITERGRHGLVAHLSLLEDRVVALLGSPEQRDALAARGLRRASDYDIQRVARRYAELYRRLLTP